MNTFAFTLDLSKTAYMEPLRIRQGDQNGTTVQATILDHGVALEGSYTARFCMRHPGTGATYYRETGTYANGVATVALDEQYAASVPGRTTAYIQLLQGSTVIASTSDIPVVILHDATEDAVPGEVYDSAIEDALAELDEATGRISIMVQEQVAEELAAHPEWTTTVQDNSVTDAKLIQSGGILSRNQRLMYRLANLLTHRTDEGTLAAISDAAKTPMAGLSVYGLSTQDGTPTPSSPVPIVSVEGDSEGNISLRAQGLNVAHPLPGTHDNKGITVTVAEDGWITVSGTSTATSSALISIGIGSTDTNIHVIEGAPSFALYIENEGALVSGEVELQVYGSNGEATNVGGYAAASRILTMLTDYISRIVVFVRAASNGKTYSGRFRFSLVRSDQMPTEYIPYVETVTPIDLDGHELRSLPDGTRDELTVDAEGHVTLVQRVGSVVPTSTNVNYSTSNPELGICIFRDPNQPAKVADGTSGNLMSSRFVPTTSSNANMPNGSTKVRKPTSTAQYAFIYYKNEDFTTTEQQKAWLDANPTEFLFELDTPVTHDLGTVPLVPLVGPDLTAQTVPTAPFVLTYERDATIVLDRLTAMWGNVAPMEGDTASASYSVGSYLMHGGQLCKVTTQSPRARPSSSAPTSWPRRSWRK